MFRFLAVALILLSHPAFAIDHADCVKLCLGDGNGPAACEAGCNPHRYIRMSTPPRPGREPQTDQACMEDCMKATVDGGIRPVYDSGNCSSMCYY